MQKSMGLAYSSTYENTFTDIQKFLLSEKNTKQLQWCSFSSTQKNNKSPSQSDRVRKQIFEKTGRSASSISISSHVNISTY